MKRRNIKFYIRLFARDALNVFYYSFTRRSHFRLARIAWKSLISRGRNSSFVYGPTGIRSFVETALAVSGTRLKYDLHIHEFTEGVIFEDEQFIVTAKLLDHGLPSYGFRIVEKDLPGTLLVDQLRALGVRPGPIYQQIKRGEIVTLDDGTVIDGRNFVAPPKKGRIVSIIGDTRYCEASVELAKQADVLVHEATFRAKEAHLAHDYYHSTTLQAAEVAKRAEVKQLILTHISSRYQGEMCDELVEEAKTVFPNVSLAFDFSSFPILRKEG